MNMDKKLQREIYLEKEKCETLLQNVWERGFEIEKLIALKRISDTSIIDKFKEVRLMKLSDEKLSELNKIRDMLLTMEVSDEMDIGKIEYIKACVSTYRLKYEKEPYDPERFHNAIAYIKMAVQKLRRETRPIVRAALKIKDKHDRFVTMIAIESVFRQEMEYEMFDMVSTINDMKDISAVVELLDEINE